MSRWHRPGVEVASLLGAHVPSSCIHHQGVVSANSSVANDFWRPKGIPDGPGSWVPLVDVPKTITGWWLGHPSEKIWKSVGTTIPYIRKNTKFVPNHQADKYHFIYLIKKCCFAGWYIGTCGSSNALILVILAIFWFCHGKYHAAHQNDTFCD